MKLTGTAVELTPSDLVKTLQIMGVFKSVAREQYFNEIKDPKLLQDVALVDTLMDTVLSRTWEAEDDVHSCMLDVHESFGIWLVLDNYRQYLLETEKYEEMEAHLKLMNKFKHKGE